MREIAPLLVIILVYLLVFAYNKNYTERKFRRK